VRLLDGFQIGRLDFCTQHVTTSNTKLFLIYSYTLQFTITYTLGFSFFTSRIPTTDFNTTIITSKFSSQADHLFSIIFHCRLKRLIQFYLNWPWIRFIQPRGRHNRKHRFHRYRPKIPRLLLAYTLLPGHVYRDIAGQRTSTLAFRCHVTLSVYARKRKLKKIGR
jgi:hypothetical protein